MFTGIVETMGLVRHVDTASGGTRLVIGCGDLSLKDVKVGDSIAVNGCCLTVVNLDIAPQDITGLTHCRRRRHKHYQQHEFQKGNLSLEFHESIIFTQEAVVVYKNKKGLPDFGSPIKLGESHS